MYSAMAESRHLVKPQGEEYETMVQDICSVGYIFHFPVSFIFFSVSFLFPLFSFLSLSFPFSFLSFLFPFLSLSFILFPFYVGYIYANVILIYSAQVVMLMSEATLIAVNLHSIKTGRR